MKKSTQEEINTVGRSILQELSEIANRVNSEWFPIAVSFAILPDNRDDEFDRDAFQGGSIRWMDRDEPYLINLVKYAVDKTASCENTAPQK